MPKPTKYTAEIADAICSRLADGESLRSICRDETMPNKWRVFKWLDEDETFLNQYTRARELQADSHVDDIIDIADNPSLTSDDRRVRIDARKWSAGKMRPKRYGDKLNHEGNIGVTVNLESDADKL